MRDRFQKYYHFVLYLVMIRIKFVQRAQIMQELCAKLIVN